MTSDAPKPASYKETLNLPATNFPMQAKLVESEPKRLEKWRAMNLYQRTLDARTDAEPWILHDGPPFANGDIHIGHVINKTLKDVFLRWHCMKGYRTPYVPGWDCHGLPIEHKIQQELGPRLREMNTVEIRQRCFAYAEKYATLQNEQFQRLGILGDWGDPYQTMRPGYEASTLEVFAKFVEAGLVYKQLKPVYWSIANQTALADAEIEYQTRDDTSVYVFFDVEDIAQLPADMRSAVPADARVSLLIWTTTPWTLPANLAVAVHPQGNYQLVQFERDGATHYAILNRTLVEKVVALGGGSNVQVLATVTGEALAEATKYRHPFIERVNPIVTAEYVTFEDGTGLVHTAPGHGEDDYNTGMRYQLGVYCPVLHNGRFDDTAPDWLRGIVVWDANKLIPQRLRESGHLWHQQTISHSYPHDWRSKTPIIFRATEQWFVSVDKPFVPAGQGGTPRSLRDRARDCIGSTIDFVPKWGEARLRGMLESRPDWCVSRQRAWGLPIPVFYNETGEPLLTPESVRAVSRAFAAKGSDAWFTDSPAELLGKDFKYPAGFSADTLRKEQDIFDVWFESGSSWHAVLQGREGLPFPADLYLEGSDQHRGWFQLSLLPSLGVMGQPPYKRLLTHGFVVKPDGTKVSKSDKEYVTATQEINRHGADLLRLWCCSVDYQNDIPTSPAMIKEFGDKYRKIRNTLRYLLSNINDFDASQPPAISASSLDGWALAQLDQLIVDVSAAYDAYQLHRAFRLIHDFCAVQISSLYGNAMKDRLYCELPDAPIRRRCQWVMLQMVTVLTKLVAPMLVYTADETWEFIKQKSAEDAALDSVHLATVPKVTGQTIDAAQQEEWNLLMTLRDDALIQLDQLKKDVGLNKAGDAEVVYYVDDDQMRRTLQKYGADLEDIVGCGFHSIAEASTEAPAATVKVFDRRETYPACARSWKRRPDVGQNAKYPDLSLRDAMAMEAR